MTYKYEIRTSEKLGRYLVAAKDIKAGEKILFDEPFVLGPNMDTSLVCFNCYLPLISKFFVCKNCAVAPICPGEGCPEPLNKKWHNNAECEFFKNLKLTKEMNPLTMMQNVGSLSVLRALLMRRNDPKLWEKFMQLETHLDERKISGVCDFYENIVKFIQSLDLLTDQDSDLVQKICAAIDVNSFEVRGPAIAAIGCGETLRGVYLQAALLAHDCVANTHMSINDNNLLVCHASVDIMKGEAIYYNYTDPLKGTAVRQKHLLIGKYFKCVCDRCSDVTELGTHMSSAICPGCKKGYISRTTEDQWTCSDCQGQFLNADIERQVQCCSDKLDVINKKDQKELEEYIRNVSLVLAPNHYLLLDVKQRLAGVLRDTINREPHPLKKVIRRKLELCKEIMPVLEKLSPGILRTKGFHLRQAVNVPYLKMTESFYVNKPLDTGGFPSEILETITLYELHAAMVMLAKKMFDSRELTASAYMDELMRAEKYLKRSLEMLFIEPGNSPEGELCAKALEEYRALKGTMSKVLDVMHAEGNTYVSKTEE